jgi:23S rRNA (cytosine1962-C5)-methyltransferase
MARIPEIALPATLREQLARGHPWVYRDHVPPTVRLPPGTWVRARCGGWVGYGLWDATGAIALRIFSERRVPDAGWVRERVAAAWELREALIEMDCTAFRWVYGEGDGVPGLVVDRYGDWAAIQSHLAGGDALLGWLADALREVYPLRGIVLRSRASANELASDDERRSPLVAGRASVLWGAPPPADLTVTEHGLRFYADLLGGQKTGLFLDQRENRRYIESVAAGREVLNCFAYTGAFSLYALRGGARRVVSVDSGGGLAEAAAANIALNGLSAARHRFETADCFELLARYAAEGRRFDLVILDPPSFARRKESRYAALRAYTRLNALALRCVAPGGLLASASCTSQVGPEAFREMLGAAAREAGARLRIVHEAGHPADHPVPAGFPEGRYLKFVVGQVSEPA